MKEGNEKARFVQCEWCMKWNSPFAVIKGEKHICGPECLMYFAAYLLGWEKAKKAAKEILEVIERHEEAEREREKDGLPF